VHIALLCATQRGLRCLQKLVEMLPEASLVVFSFREESWEPPFLDDIRKLAISAGGRFFETTQVGETRFASFWDTTLIDLMLVVSWRYIIPARVYLRPRSGTFVFHDSLLPEYRGFAPTVWAMINGEDHTGVTLFAMSEAIDAGDIVDQKRIPIGPDATIAETVNRVTQTYVELLEANLPRLLDGSAPRHIQDHSRATFTCKRTPTDAEIDWSSTTENIYNLIRASSAPYPGAYTYLGGKKLVIWSAAWMGNGRRYVGRVPGRIVEVKPGEGSIVLTGNGCLMLKTVQIEGSNTVCAADLLKHLSQTLGR